MRNTCPSGGVHQDSEQSAATTRLRRDRDACRRKQRTALDRLTGNAATVGATSASTMERENPAFRGQPSALLTRSAFNRTSLMQNNSKDFFGSTASALSRFPPSASPCYRVPRSFSVDSL